MSDNRVTIRIGVDGRASVQGDLEAIAASGDASAARLAKSYLRASDEIEVAMRKQARAAAQLAATQPQTSTQQIYQAGAATNYTGPNAAESAARFKELLAEEEKRARTLEAMREQLDPLYAAQKRYDAEIAAAAPLLKAGSEGQDLYAKAVARADAELARAKRALTDHGDALGFNRTQFLIAEGAAHRFADSVLAGQSPIRALTMQAGDLANVLALDDGGVAGGLAKVTRFLTPVTVGIGALTVAAGVSVAAWLEYTDAIDKFDTLSRGAGRLLGETGEQLNANAEAAAAAANITVGSAREIEKAYLGVARSGDVLTGLTALTEDFAAATGTDAKAAAQQLAAAFADPIKGAQTMAESYGILSQAQVENISNLVAEGRQLEAQKALLDDVSQAFKGAGESTNALTRGLNNIAVAAASAFNYVGKLYNSLTNSSIDDQIASLRKRLDAGPTVGQALFGGFDADAIQKQIDHLRYQQRQDAARVQRDKDNAAVVAGQSVADQFTGASQLKAYRDNAGALTAALRSNLLSPDKRKELTDTLNAYNHAIDTFIPAQEKANRLAAIDAQIAAAKTPAQKAALAQRRAEIEAAGQVITKEDALARARDKGAAAAATADKAGEGHAATLARQAAAMVAAAKGSLDLADAYLKGGDAAIRAEAARKAMTDATRAGTDIDAQIARQTALDVAETLANSAKTIAALRDETAARADINRAIAAGKLPVDALTRALSDEAALRPLLRLQTVAQGDALKLLTRETDAYRQALAAAHQEEAHSGALRVIDDINQRIAESRAVQAELGSDTYTQAIDAARRAAQRQAARDNYSSADTASVVDASVDLARQQAAERAAQEVEGRVRAQRASIDLLRQEGLLITANDDVRTRELSNLRLKQELLEKFPQLTDDELARVLDGNDALERQAAIIRRQQADWQELKQFGDQFVDDVLSPSNWSNFGDWGKRVLADIAQEFEKLALLNPLKNALFGESNPTLGGVGGLFKSLFGGDAGKDAASIGDIFGGSSEPFGFFASGTEYAPGGRAVVGENGPEIVDLPRGARVSNAAETRRRLGMDNAPVQVSMPVTIYAPGADAAALARVEQQVKVLEESLPSRIVATVHDARVRRILK